MLYKSFCLFLFALLIACSADIQNNITYKAISPSTLWYNKPATEWKQALPLGNGRLGAMVFGDVNNERIQFNEDSVWTGKPQTTTFATDGPANFPKIRKLIFEGKRLEAQKLYTKTVIKDEEQHWNFASYQPTGDLWLDFEDGGHVTNYKRVLNLNTAISTVSYTKDEVNYKREVFVSHPDQAMIVRLTADQKSKLSLKVKLTRPYKKVKWDEKEQRQNLSATAVGDTLILNGDTGEAIKYQARLKPIVEDGTVSTSKNSIDIRNASSVTLYLVAETNFINYHNVNKKFNEEAQDKLKSIVKKAYSNILSDHIRAHQEIFNRVQIELPKSKNSTLPTDQRIKKFAEGEKDPSLAALIFQFGRYTLLTSSRPNTQPANLQGLWNNSLSPSWDGKYTTNINFQMNYCTRLVNTGGVWHTS